MRGLLISLSGLICCTCSFLGPVAVALSEDQQLAPLVEGNSEFAFDLYARLGEAEGNIFLSPYSISAALAMTYAGARGRTEKEMSDVLHFPFEHDMLHGAFSQLRETLNPATEVKPYALHTANALWGQENHRFLPEFAGTVRRYYEGGFNVVNYATAPEKARERINHWVEEQTHNKIKDLIKPVPIDISSSTVLVLTNAIYFKGDWLSQFDPEQTADMPFHVNEDHQVSVPMMHQTAPLSHTQNEHMSMLELPYEGDDLSMLLLLPRHKNGIRQLERMLSVDNVSKWTRQLEHKAVSAYVPRFEVTVRFELQHALQALGMKTAFGRGADFSGMTGHRELFISKVIHKAFVIVNEEGTEAAAATAVTMKRSRPPVFMADHPFVFLIRDKRSGSILFMGRIANPTIRENDLSG